MNMKKVTLIAIPTFTLASALAFPAAAFADQTDQSNSSNIDQYQSATVDQSNSDGGTTTSAR